ncbi:GTP cyclohydrolase II [Spirillospora sp. NPDC127200]
MLEGTQADHIPSPGPAYGPADGETPIAPRVRTRVAIPVRATADAPWTQAEVVSFEGLHDGREHLALVFGDPTPVPLVRLHSECLTGDVFGSARCDCGPQLQEAMALLSDSGGVVLYLRQEGRGIGLYNKLDAYLLQDQGLDTFAANRRLDFPDDQRDYHAAAQMLTALGVGSARLLTNNGDKASQLRRHGIAVPEVVSTGVFVNAANHRYLTAKAEIAGHRIAGLKDPV